MEDKYSKARKNKGLRKLILSPDDEQPTLKRAREEMENTRGISNMKKGGSTNKWIQKAIKKPGALKSALGVKKDKTIPAGKLAKAAKAPGKLGQRARLAQTLKKMK